MRCALRLIADICDIAVITDDGDFAFEQTITLPHTYGEFLTSLADRLGHADPSGNVSSVGVSISGDYSAQTGLVHCPSNALIDGQSLKADLQASLNCEVWIASHAHMLALSARQQGEFRDSQQIFSLYLDDEVCAGQLIGDHLLLGASGLAGNWGHICLPWPVEFELEGRECACGRSGCLNLFVSRQALSLEYQFLSEKSLSAEDVFAAAMQGDIVAESAVQIFEDRLARGLAMVINLCDPDVILLSGRMALASRILVNIPRKWPGYVRGGAPATRLEANLPSDQLLQHACLRGAATRPRH